jgi:hypothetical protein
MIEKTLCRADFINPPRELLPMIALTFDPRLFFSVAAAKKQKGLYAHMMWLTGPRTFATQALTYRLVDADDYMDCIVKLVCCPSWTFDQRHILQAAIQRRLALPIWKRLYDVPDLFGHLVGLTWIDLPGFEICSDSADIIRLVNPYYDLQHATPTSFNEWLKLNKDTFFVWGRYNAGD